MTENMNRLLSGQERVRVAGCLKFHDFDIVNQRFFSDDKRIFSALLVNKNVCIVIFSGIFNLNIQNKP